jgi:pyridoxamine 5'-phosphate oxidase-like protein
MTNRPTSARISATLERLNSESNVWVATSSVSGIPHLVPLSLAWYDDVILVATPSNTPTARNILATGRARASLDSAEDVAIFETVAETTSFADASEGTKAAYVSRVGWNPNDEAGDWSLISLTPRLIHAWNGVAEIQGRTIMQDGEWIAD